jgi:hypothetical protein
MYRSFELRLRQLVSLVLFHCFVYRQNSFPNTKYKTLKINILSNKFSIRIDKRSLMRTDEKDIMVVKFKKRIIFHLFSYRGTVIEWIFCPLHYRRPTCRSLFLAVFPTRTGVYILPLHFTAAKVGHSMYIATYVCVM